MLNINNIMLKDKLHMYIHTHYIFREIAGVWRRVDSQEPKPLTLADYLNKLQINIDENTQFCRIIRYKENTKETIIYKTYKNAKVEIYVTEDKT